MPRAFVIRPFNKKKDAAGKEIDFERVHDELIGPALTEADFDGGTTGEMVDSGNIRADMFALILGADLVVCDMTIHNANVFYELGIRHALRKRRTVLIKGGPTSDPTPFDNLTDRYLPYDVDNPASARDELQQIIAATMKSDRETDSPVFHLLPNLAEADASAAQVVPLSFREEVDRARASKSKGWLRLLSEEVQPLPFHWEGLKLVAKAQWDLKDWEGALESWEEIRETNSHDVASNLAVANLYERMYRKDKKPEQIEKSEQALARVLDGDSARHGQYVEALTLHGRNEKTLWRLEFEELNSVAERRTKATNRSSRKSYEAYRDAFSQDLNHYYSGLAALQMAKILQDLSADEAWLNAFGSDREGEDYKRELDERVPPLSAAVEMSVAGALRRTPNDVWAKISAADVLFSGSEREGRIIEAYRDAIPASEPFAWDAARGQLKLFADLGVKTDLATAVIKDIDPRFAGGKKKAKPTHLIVFAGHQLDTPGRPEARFPEEKVEQVRARIRSEVEALIDDEHELVALASAAHGADILSHEVCDELGIKSRICLPMPCSDFARNAFEDRDEWRTRFLNLAEGHEVVELSDKEGLPDWLPDGQANPWERGNEWVINMSLSWGAKRITLIALWDGKQTGDAPGGTAQFVKLAEDAGKVHIHRIDSTKLLL